MDDGLYTVTEQDNGKFEVHMPGVIYVLTAKELKTLTYSAIRAYDQCVLLKAERTFQARQRDNKLFVRTVLGGE